MAIADPQAGELWTTGQAADYLADLGVTRRQVSRMVTSGELAGVRRGTGKWARIPAAAVMRHREELLAQLNRTKPTTPGR